MYLQDFHIGQQFDIPPVTIDKDKMLAFAREYDPLPLHLDENFAAATAFKGLIAPGVMSFMAVWAEFVKMNLWQDSLIAGRSTAIEWFEPVYPGDVLTGHAYVTGLHKNRSTTGTIEIAVDIYNQHRILAIRDVTKAVLKVKP